MTLFVYVDNSNVWIEGMRISAVKKGLATSPSDAMERKITDHAWAYDFGRLYGAICPDGALIGRSSLFGSRPPANDSLWKLAENAGFQVEVFDRNFSNKEKEVDSAITTQILEDSFLYMKSDQDRVVLVAGDRDYVPPIESLARRGIPTTVIFWQHATARDLRAKADDYSPLDPLFEHISH
jgi:uncharacterized LabA/DUF88 family protein